MRASGRPKVWEQGSGPMQKPLLRKVNLRVPLSMAKRQDEAAIREVYLEMTQTKVGIVGVRLA